jgi:hypothetical protein
MAAARLEGWFVEHGAFPKLTPTTVRRRSIENWFAFQRDTPLRYVYGPTGSGKTTVTLLHGRLARHAVAFVSMPSAGTSDALLAALNEVFDSCATDIGDVPRLFVRHERFELVIADVDNANDEVREFLTRLPSNVPPNVTLTYLARARGVVDMVALTTKGIGAPLDRKLLAFSQAEAAELCEAFNVSYTPADINQLIYASEGWAFAVTGSIRDAAADGRELRGALTRWQDQHRRLIEELLTRSVAGLPPGEAEAAQRIYAGENPTAEPAYARLHDLGLLLSFSDDDLRPLRAVIPTSLKRDVSVDMIAPAVNVSMATMEMFGQFEMVIDGRKVEWCRRRDRQIVEYLALQLDTSATRHNIISTFWPNTDAQLAGQSLRTACSTIRRAIAQCVGYDRVHYYFTAGRALRLNTDNLSISSLRLRGHMREAEEVAGDFSDAAAQAHYRAVSRIYRGRLLDSEGTEPWFRAEREAYSELAADAAERLVDIGARPRAFAKPRHGFNTALLSG